MLQHCVALYIRIVRYYMRHKQARNNCASDMLSAAVYSVSLVLSIAFSTIAVMACEFFNFTMK